MNPLIALSVLMMGLLVSDQIQPAEAGKIKITIRLKKVTISIEFEWGKRKRRDLPAMQPAPSACGGGVSLSRFSSSMLKKMDGKDFDVEIERFQDRNGVPVYDVIKLISDTETLYFTTITNEFDCTSILTEGECTLYGEEDNGQVTHAYITNPNQAQSKGSSLKDPVVIGAVVGGLVFLAAICGIVAVVVMVRRQQLSGGAASKEAVAVGGVNNHAYEVKTVA